MGGVTVGLVSVVAAQAGNPINAMTSKTNPVIVQI